MPNVKQAVPFFMVVDIGKSIRFYQDGLSFEMKHKWIDKGVLRWCWLTLGDASLMLQQHREPESKVGLGAEICFQCEDALAIYREAVARGLQPQTPFVGNQLWVTTFIDPDGYRLSFQSPTDAPEETVLQEP